MNKKAVRAKSGAYYKTYKEARNRVSKIKSYSKKEYYQTNIENNKCNLKIMWKHNQLIRMNSKTIYIALVKSEHKILYKNMEIAQEFNNYFSNVSVNLSINIPQIDCSSEQYVTQASSELFFFPNKFQCLKF